MKEFAEFELTKEFRDRFQQALDENDAAFIVSSLEEVNPADITALLYEFGHEESKYVLDLLSLQVRSQIINDLEPETTQDDVRDARVQAVRLLNAALSHIEAALCEKSATLVTVACRFWSVAYGIGANCCAGVSMTDRAQTLGIERATISKGATAFCAANDLEPSWSMKRECARTSFAAARIQSIKRNGALPSVPPKGRTV